MPPGKNSNKTLTQQARVNATSVDHMLLFYGSQNYKSICKYDSGYMNLEQNVIGSCKSQLNAVLSLST